MIVDLGDFFVVRCSKCGYTEKIDKQALQNSKKELGDYLLSKGWTIYSLKHTECVLCRDA